MRCRICADTIEEPFLSLGHSPLSNAFLSREDLGRMEPFYPLDVYACRRCHFALLPEFERAENIFADDYAYYSSYSTSWLEHCRDYVDMAVERFSLDSRSRVVEIASNDGYLLQYFQPHGVDILGIEPAEGTARVAIDKGIPTEVAFFNTSFARGMVAVGRQADLIIGNNVLAHVPELHDFVEGLRIALQPAGVITMEFPHLLRLIQGNQFDTIYHEHFSYFSFYAVNKLLADHQLAVIDVEELATHGGSLRVYAAHAAGPRQVREGCGAKLLREEEAAGLYAEGAYSDFGERTKAIKRELLLFLIGAKEDGKRVAGYGAPAKGNTLLNYCGVRTDLLDYTVDRSPYKQGRFLPGTHIPIHPPAFIDEDRPDYLLVLPWNLKDEIMEQMSHIRDWGGRFVLHLPALEVL